MESDGVYGSRMIWQRMRRQGERCGKPRIARLLWRESLRGIPSPERLKRRAAGIRLIGIINQLVRDFSAPVQNAKWVTDITFFPMQEDLLSLTVVLGLFS